MNVRTCPWLNDDGSICSTPPKDDRHRVGLCEFHSSVQYHIQLASQGRLLNELEVTDHSPGFTYVAETGEGSYRLGHAGSMKLLVPKLRKAFGNGELVKVATLIDGGKSRYLTLIAQFSPFWIRGTSTYDPHEELTKEIAALPRSDMFSDLPRNMTGLTDLFAW